MTDSILRSYRSYTTTSIVPFPVAAVHAPADDALELLTDETDGFAIDATSYGSITAAAYLGGPVGGTTAVIDTGTPANNLSNVALDNSNLVQSGTSAKICQFPTSPFARWSPHNMLLQSQTFNTTWSQTAGVITADATTAPDGTSTADLWTTNTPATNEEAAQAVTLVAGFTYSFSIYVKRGNTDWFRIRLADSSSNTADYLRAWFNLNTMTVGTVASLGTYTAATATLENVDGTWMRVKLTGIPGSTDGKAYFNSASANNSATRVDGATYYIWGAQVNRGPIATPYLVTVASSRIGIPQTYDAAESKYAIWSEPAATNLCLQSDDFTNASWTKSNMTTAKTATGPDSGTTSATTATTLTASAGNATALQAITSASSNRITSTWIKRRTGSGTVELTQDNGSTWTPVTVTADWTRVSIASVSSTDPTVGIRIVTNADAVDVWGFQHETGTVVTSTISTTTATVTRAADVVSAAETSFPGSDTNNTIYLDYKPRLVTSGIRNAWSYWKDASNFYTVYGSTSDPLFDSVVATTASPSGLDLGTLVTETRTQISMAVKASDFDASQDGAALVSTGTGSVTTGYTTLYIGTTGATTTELNGYIYRLVQVPYQRQTVNSDLLTWRYNY